MKSARDGGIEILRPGWGRSRAWYHAVMILFEIGIELSDDDAELLEAELGTIANELAIEGVDIAGFAEEGVEVYSSFMLYYEDDAEDDDQLFRYGQEIVDEFERLHSKGETWTKEFAPVVARIGRIRLKLVRE
jgi:hypothetical protein